MNTFSVPTFVAVYLALCGGYLRNTLAGSVVLNSNAIKNLPGGGISNPSQTVSVSPRASASEGGVGQAGATGSLSVSIIKQFCCCVKIYLRILHAIEDYFAHFPSNGMLFTTEFLMSPPT